MTTLKVFRTAIGFHDAYVAAPSRKAALAAWGSDKDLFARGAAELVTDPALIEEPLAAPGTVVRRLRATAAEQLAAAPPARSRAKARGAKAAPAAPPPTPPPPPLPRPSRAALDAADAALEAAGRRHADELAALAEREAALARERQRLLAAHKGEDTRLARDRDRAARAYDEAIEAWRADAA